MNSKPWRFVREWDGQILTLACGHLAVRKKPAGRKIKKVRCAMCSAPTAGTSEGETQ